MTKKGRRVSPRKAKEPSRTRSATLAAILGATIMSPACDGEVGDAPPIDYDASADSALDASLEPDTNFTFGDGSTLVDLDGEADAGVFHRDGGTHDGATGNDAGTGHDATAGRDGSGGGGGGGGGGVGGTGGTGGGGGSMGEIS